MGHQCATSGDQLQFWVRPSNQGQQDQPQNLSNVPVGWKPLTQRSAQARRERSDGHQEAAPGPNTTSVHWGDPQQSLGYNMQILEFPICIRHKCDIRCSISLRNFLPRLFARVSTSSDRRGASCEKKKKKLQGASQHKAVSCEGASGVVRGRS